MVYDFEAMFSDAGAGDASYSHDELLGVYKNLNYEECRNIFHKWALGERIATALPNFALAPGRKVSIGKNEPELIKLFDKTAQALNIDEVAYRAAVYSRIYGISFIYAATNAVKPSEPLTAKMIMRGDADDLKFNVLDPLSAQHSVSLDNDGLSPTFGLPLNFVIRGQKIHTKRVRMVQNGLPLYLQWNVSNRSFCGPSIYQNMTLLIRSWNRAVVALQRLATKAAALIVKTKDVPTYASGLAQASMQKSLELIRLMENDGIARLPQDASCEFFALTGVSEIDVIINKIQSALMMALNDTPSGILLDKNLAQSMSDGDNDMKAIIIATERFRNNIMKPIYQFLDEYVIAKMCDKELFALLRDDYGDIYGGMSDGEIYAQLKESYEFEFNPLYPQTANEEADTLSKRLDNFTKLKDLGAEMSGIEEAINKYSKEIGAEIILNETQFDASQETATHGDGDSFADSSADSSANSSAPSTIDSPKAEPGDS